MLRSVPGLVLSNEATSEEPRQQDQAVRLKGVPHPVAHLGALATVHWHIFPLFFQCVSRWD